jgi:hypothetical protein
MKNNQSCLQMGQFEKAANVFRNDATKVVHAEVSENKETRKSNL